MNWQTDPSKAKVGHRYEVTVELPKDGPMVVHAMRGVRRWVLIGCVDSAVVVAWCEIPEPYKGKA